MPVTYEPLATNTIVGSSTSSVTFSNISGSYTDLVVVFGSFQGTTNFSFAIRFNGDTGSNYSYTNIEGDGTSVFAARSSTTGWFNGANIGFPDSKSNAIFHIMNYSNTTTNKTGLCRYNYLGSGLPGTGASVGLWRNTAAITSVTAFISSGNFTADGTITLYGVKAA